MGASSKRERRVQMRKRQQKQSRKPKFDTKNEEPHIARSLATKKFSNKDLLNLQPLNDNQADFLEKYYSDVPVLTATGPAGTAKTMLSMFCALQDAFDDGEPEIDKVVIVRSAVEAVGQGFLPGDLDEKNAPYEIPYIQMCKELLPAYNDPYQHLKAAGYLEFTTTGFLRGQTFHRSIVIIEEAQNFDYELLQTACTRLGDHSRLIVTGDIKQSDLMREGKKSGLDKFMHVLSKMPAGYHDHVKYELEDIVRSGLVREFLIADHYYG